MLAAPGVSGCWQPQIVTLFDVQVVNTDAKSCIQYNVEAVLSSAEHMKKMKYVDAVEARHATFAPFVVSGDDVLGREARVFVNCLGDSIADMWKKSHSEVMGRVGAKMPFAILRATDLCLHGSRTKWRRVMDINDGAGLPSYKD